MLPAAGILADYGIREDLIFSDVASGRTMARTGWMDLMSRVQPGDTIVVAFLDRFSRDFEEGALPVGTVCEGCKALAVPYAVNLIRDLEADCRVDDAGEYRQLADTLLRETDPLIHVCGPSCVQQPAVRPLTGAAPPQTR